MTIIDNQQQQQGINPNMYNMPLDSHIPSGPSADFFLFRLDSSDIIDEIEHQLRGEVWTSNPNGGGSYTKKYAQDLNEEGISDIINIIYSFGINKNNILGCLTHEEIYQRCSSIWKKLAKYFMVSDHKIGIDKNKRDVLVTKIVYMIHSSLSRSEEGRESDQLSTASQRVEHFLKEEKPRSTINPLNWFGGKK